MHLNYEGITYNIPAIVRLVRNQHRLENIQDEKFCSACKCVWPCPTAIIVEAAKIMLEGQMNIAVSSSPSSESIIK
jgi:hypothetical protein